MELYSRTYFIKQHRTNLLNQMIISKTFNTFDCTAVCQFFAIFSDKFCNNIYYLVVCKTEQLLHQNQNELLYYQHFVL